MSKKGALSDYDKKRCFRKTPKPADRSCRTPSGEPIFVIQKHKARSLHYDFRLEVDGVLVSWAVPKGPSTNPKDKRLAVMVEDHPLEYADFEGAIPADECGGGPVIVWDRGTYRNLMAEAEGNKPANSMPESIAGGHVAVELRGEKLRGGYALVRTKIGGHEKNWLLIKIRDEEVNPKRDPVRDEPQSVISGRTIEELLAQEG